jgi:hypothetical protein
MAKIIKFSGYFIDISDVYDSRDIEIALREFPDVLSRHIRVEEKDIKEWEDDIPLNHKDCPESECEKYFMGGDK